MTGSVFHGLWNKVYMIGSYNPDPNKNSKEPGWTGHFSTAKLPHAFALFVDRPELFFFQQLGSQMSEGYFFGFWKMITLMGTNISPYRLALWFSSEGSFPTKQNCFPKKFEVESLSLRHSIGNLLSFGGERQGWWTMISWSVFNAVLIRLVSTRLQWLGNLCHHSSSFLGALLNDLG